MKRVRLAIVLAFGVLWSACGGAEELQPPPPPLRPKPVDIDKPRHQTAKDDCEVADPADDDPAKTFQQRSIPEAEKLAQQGVANLKAAASKEVDPQTRESLITDAVDLFITALLADPYNVGATYGLAGAYARIDRPQCSINLLVRLLQMRPHPSKRAEVEAHLDRLLGRKTTLDPDFADMRRDKRFRDLIQKMCEGTNDPNCVYGAMRDGRER